MKLLKYIYNIFFNRPRKYEGFQFLAFIIFTNKEASVARQTNSEGDCSLRKNFRLCQTVVRNKPYAKSFLSAN